MGLDMSIERRFAGKCLATVRGVTFIRSSACMRTTVASETARITECFAAAGVFAGMRPFTSMYPQVHRKCRTLS